MESGVLITIVICGTIYKLAELFKKKNRPQNGNSDRRN